jgi:hypothetical protein
VSKRSSSKAARAPKPKYTGPYRKPRADIYTWMLALALVAILIACLCLYLEVADYGPQPYKLSMAAPAALDVASAPLVTPAGSFRLEGPCVPDSPFYVKTLIHG